MDWSGFSGARVIPSKHWKQNKIIIRTCKHLIAFHFHFFHFFLMGTFTSVFHVKTQTQVPCLYLVILIWRYWEVFGILLPLLLTLSCLVQKYVVHTQSPDPQPPKFTRASQTSLVSHELQLNIFYIECSGAVYWVKAGTSMPCSFFSREIYGKALGVSCMWKIRLWVLSSFTNLFLPISGEWISVLWAPALNFWPPTIHVQGNVLPAETADGTGWSDFHRLCFHWRWCHIYGVRYAWIWYFFSLAQSFLLWRVFLKF